MWLNFDLLTEKKGPDITTVEFHYSIVKCTVHDSVKNDSVHISLNRKKKKTQIARPSAKEENKDSLFNCKDLNIRSLSLSPSLFAENMAAAAMFKL
jgi:hypothetical protein